MATAPARRCGGTAIACKMQSRKGGRAMSAERKATPHLPIHVTESGRIGLKLFEREIATYLRELPRLLKEDQAWRHALIKGEEIVGIWQTDAEAIEAGRERFGLDPIYVKRIDPRDHDRFARPEQWKQS